MIYQNLILFQFSLISGADESNKDNDIFAQMDNERAELALVTSLVNVLDRARFHPANDFLFVEASTSEISAMALGNFSVTPVRSRDEALQYIKTNLAAFQSNLGCLLLLLSAMHSRGIDNLLHDMDEDTHTMIGPFGHCTQETINLLLTGRATSNVFDGDILLGDSGLCLKGIATKCSVGYLSQLEALRLCQVGSFYKKPVYPVWVVGSASHFTVLFSTDMRVNQESQEEELLSKVQRAFKAIDQEQCGFIAADSLDKVLQELGLLPSGDPCYASKLRSHLKIDGDIILWSSLWEAISRLMTGASLDAVMRGSAGATSSVPRKRSDSEVARDMQEKWNNDEMYVAPEPEDDISWVLNDVDAKVDRGSFHRSDSIADGTSRPALSIFYLIACS